MFRTMGLTEILLIIAVLLLLFGSKKLPQLSKSIGESLREFKKSIKSEDTTGAESGDDAEKKG